MTRKDLENAFEEAKENKSAICAEIEMPGQLTNELIINSFEALDNKLNYYLKTYDENLVHCMNDSPVLYVLFVRAALFAEGFKIKLRSFRVADYAKV